MSKKASKSRGAAALGRKGGLATAKRYGKNHFKKLAALSNKAQGKGSK